MVQGRVEAGYARASLVLFDVSESSLARGRRSRRTRVLAMRPTDPTETALAERSRSFPQQGKHWEYVRADGISLFVRARDVADVEDAHWDANRVFGIAPQLRTVFVRDRETGELSWWLATEREAILVSPRIWPASQRVMVQRHAKHAVRALGFQPEWGETPVDR